MQRTLVRELVEKIDQTVVVKGWVNMVRDHGKITFIDLRDRTGIVQAVGRLDQKLSLESAVEVTAKVARRPEKLVNKDIDTGEIELQIESLNLISASQETPFDMGKVDLDLSLPVLLDNRPLTLKNNKQAAIFKVQEKVADNFRKAAIDLGCQEIFVPTISASATEGGSEVFEVKYYDKSAYLTQSPQLYKQIAVGAFERVYLFSHAYRAEPSVTTRHLSEIVQMDCEIGFINDFEELLDAVESVGSKMIVDTFNQLPADIKLFGVEKPKLESKVPRLKLLEAQQIIKEITGRDVVGEKDLSPEDEVDICNWARKEHGSDFVTITHFPLKKRAFYTMPDPQDPELSLSFDLLFKGLEISSGSQRINDYQMLIDAIVQKGMNPDSFKMYLQAFKYGMPPEGGFSFGLERVTMKLLELSNVREASLFPRDMERIDFRLTASNEK